jgi:predicted transcriptional regulator
LVANVTENNGRGDKMRRYWKLEGLMAKYKLTQQDIADIAEMSLPAVSKKFYKGEEFKISNAVKIIQYFREKGEQMEFEDYFVEK